VTPGLPSWLATLQALALVTSPRLGLRHFKSLDVVKGFVKNAKIIQMVVEYDNMFLMPSKSKIRVLLAHQKQ
jgi:hypothetical protein